MRTPGKIACPWLEALRSPGRAVPSGACPLASIRPFPASPASRCIASRCTPPHRAKLREQSRRNASSNFRGDSRACIPSDASPLRAETAEGLDNMIEQPAMPASLRRCAGNQGISTGQVQRGSSLAPFGLCRQIIAQQMNSKNRQRSQRPISSSLACIGFVRSIKLTPFVIGAPG